MEKLARAVTSLITIFALTYCSVYGQEKSVEIDSTFEAFHQEAWQKIREAEFSDSLQNKYAKEFYSHYRDHKGSESADRAFMSTFLLWGNTGNYTHVEEAISTLENDSKLWGAVIHPLSNIYHRNEDLIYNDYIAYLHELENLITDPKSRSQLFLTLVRYYKSEGENDKVRDYAQKMVEIDVEEFFVDFALGQLHELESLQIDQQAPQFKTQTINGKSISLSDLNGEFVLLEFWGTWCGPCTPEIPYLKTLYEKYDDGTMTILGVALDENEEVVQEFTAENEMAWPQILQSKRWGGEIVESYNVSGVPRMYLVDPEGKIVAKDLRGEEMVSEVNRMIAEYFEK